jgi:hypothetical protein
MTKRSDYAPPWADKLGGDVPSMDDKDTPSPPVMTTEEYEAFKERGIIRGGYPQYYIGGIKEV